MESSSTQRLVPHFVAKHPLIVLKISLGTTNVNLMVVKEEEVKKRITNKMMISTAVDVFQPCWFKAVDHTLSFPVN